MTMNRPRLALLALLAALGGCAVTPTGPSVMTLPGSGMSLEQFQADDVLCRQYALNQIGGRTAGEASQQSAVTSAAVGTLVGALAGVAIGGNSRGAGIGAGTGLLFGSAIGSDSARASGIGTQRQYDNAYIQCMYSQGHRVPVSGNFSSQRIEQRPVSSPVNNQPPVNAAEAGIPPPPPGNPPAPPPN
ncbi:MAG: glycine zipper family protein [Betaproteobacteria bacterium]|nr:glycine zipper family protein [Betaproteobacteria bacterium]MCL2886658.1 glycine zipper family protein [Betaproteobacteria bacterium]